MKNFNKKYDKITYKIDYKIKIEKIIIWNIYKYASH